MFKFENGNSVKDLITNVTGIITAKIEYINGCKQYLIKTKSKDNKADEGTWIDEGQLVLAGKGIKLEKRDIGGSTSSAPRNNIPKNIK